MADSSCPAGEVNYTAESQTDDVTVELGNYRLSWDNSENTGGFKIFDSISNKLIWRTPKGKSFVSYHRGPWKIKEVKGFIDMQLLAAKSCHKNVISRVSSESNRFILEGRFRDENCPERFIWIWSLNKNGDLAYELNLLSESNETEKKNGLTLVMERGSETQYYGFGEQFSHIGLKGHRLPIWVQEQGLGRGDFPVSPLVKLFSLPEVAGYPFSTYVASPVWLDTTGVVHVGENAEPGFIDLSKQGRIEVSFVTKQLKGIIAFNEQPLEQIRSITRYTGRMQSLPEWVHNGLILGVQGGSDVVENVITKLKAHDMPLAAIWMQDWVGARKTSFGSQLWWNWVLDKERYPRWDEMRESLKKEGIRILSYVNPHLVKLEGKESRRKLFDEAASRGFLVKSPEGGPYLIENTDFKYGLLDVWNPAAVAWFKAVLQDELWSQGISGYMADFGESLPLDAISSAPGGPAVAHNRYPVKWAELHHEFIEEKGLADEALIFHRSGFTRSPKYTVAFWLGDQNVAWDRHDGLPSAVRGLVSGGFTGLALNHSDIGGYTTLKSPLPFTSVTRSKELLIRWAELNAFSPIFRSHEGNRPEDNHQIWSSVESLTEIAKMARVYQSLKNYRQDLEKEMEDAGWPLVRHMHLHYPDDKESESLELQFMLGSDVLVAPVVEKGENEVDVYIPSSGWCFAWTGKEVKGGWQSVDAPLGRPAAFVRCERNDLISVLQEAIK